MGDGPTLPRSTGLGCGCGASLAFLILVGLPVLFVFSFGMSPCEDGPCNPDGARDFNVVAIALLCCAALLFVGVRQVVRWRKGRHQSGPPADDAGQ
ncbi:hypothetical protein [Sphingomonas bacterium]|uniref:hypothetical protein n=1 Tax=Sphingomonas bacterium TaxID=1895847 RepID=UPI0026345133|nr:hypothetical protein [Sphingomonas bacterium]